MGIVSRRVGKLALFVSAVGCLGAVGLYFGRGSQSEDRTHALSFDLPRRGGGSVRWQPGRPAVIHFWAEWCEPCLAELPAYFQFVSRVHAVLPSEVQWIAISLDESWDANQRFLSALEQRMPGGLPKPLEMALDAEHSVAARFGSFQYPETYLLRSGGQIARKWVGPQPWLDEAMQAEFAALLKE